MPKYTITYYNLAIWNSISLLPMNWMYTVCTGNFWAPVRICPNHNFYGIILSMDIIDLLCYHASILIVIKLLIYFAPSMVSPGC
jgi:hypothetical protein